MVAMPKLLLAACIAWGVFSSIGTHQQSPIRYNDDFVLMRDQGKYVYYETIPGTDIPMAFPKKLATQEKGRGIYRLVYPMVPGMFIRDFSGKALVI